MNEVSENLSILVVGNLDHWLVAGDGLGKIANTVFCNYDDLTADFLSDLQPDIILSPLVSTYFDMMDLAIKLDQLNYEGRVRAITLPLPNPDLIVREIRFECPALDFDLIQQHSGNKLRSV